MLQAIIIDDEPKNVRVLRKLVEEFCPGVNIIAEAFDVESAYKVITSSSPDLLFLDIEMPFGNAFDLLDKLKPVSFEVIFITAFNNYALRALKYSALDYLLKPVDIDELKLAVKKASDKRQSKAINEQLNNLLYNLQKPALQKLALPTKDGLIFIHTDKIARCEASGAYTLIFTRDGEKITTSRNIKEYEELLPEGLFYRIHNSHIINLNCVKKYYKGRGGYIEMENGTTIEVATRRKEGFLKYFGI
jgi:two-component system, LytTR family, response regulator